MSPPSPHCLGIRSWYKVSIAFFGPVDIASEFFRRVIHRSMSSACRSTTFSDSLTFYWRSWWYKRCESLSQDSPRLVQIRKYIDRLLTSARYALAHRFRVNVIKNVLISNTVYCPGLDSKKDHVSALVPNTSLYNFRVHLCQGYKPQE